MIFTITILSVIPSVSAADERLAVIPKPQRIVSRQGEFPMPRGTVVAIRNSGGVPADIMNYLKSSLKSLWSVKTSDTSGRRITLILEPKASVDDESYTLSVRAQNITIKASNRKGIFNGIQTLIQMIPYGKYASIPCVDIDDKPAFAWRGLMLDCSRTFLSIDYLKKTIDIMALFKMNTLHLHLTDDQGWRISIPKYPKLTEIGSMFEPEFDEVNGYYTRDELIDLVKYADSRNITIIPEIEMPGHSIAALKSYPELSCSGGPFKILPYMLTPGICDDVMCIGNEDVFRFAETVLDEVMSIFPSKYIHIGGDEVPRTKWRSCEKCQKRMKIEGMKDESDLQHYFTSRINAFINSRGRRLIGWDEIMEGGLPPKSAVMAWRNAAYAADALGKKHKTVLCPMSHCYFDYPHEVTDTEKVYSFDPLAGIDQPQYKDILGIQACMWTHIARTDTDINKMIYPRLMALSEVGWSNDPKRNYDDFTSRMKSKFQLLDHLGANYYKEPPIPAYKDELRVSFDFAAVSGNEWKSDSRSDIVLVPDGSGSEILNAADMPNGTSGYLRIDDGSKVKGADTNRLLDFYKIPFNIEMWIKHKGQKDQKYGSTIFSYGQSGPGGWRVGINGSNRLIFSLYGIYDSIAPNSIVPSDDKWHHIKVVHKKNKDAAFYVDGIRTDELDLSAYCASPLNADIFIGNDMSGTTQFAGCIAGIKISSGEGSR